jgi:hypothetical protein
MLGCIMDNEKQLESGENVTLSQSGPDQTRRRLTGSALGVSAIFTLASSPVLAGGQCLKPSGFASGNLSGHTTPPPTYCKPPEWWCTQSSWQHFCTKDQRYHDNPFIKYSKCGDTFSKRDQWGNVLKDRWGHSIPMTCYEVAASPSTCSHETLTDLFDLGRYCLSTCLSIDSITGAAPCITTGDVMAIWQDCTINGHYEVIAGHNWSPTQCRDYLKTLCG